jgi:hypothetical protein
MNTIESFTIIWLIGGSGIAAVGEFENHPPELQPGFLIKINI